MPDRLASRRPWSDRRLAVTLFAAAWCAYALIGPGLNSANPNTVSRLGLVHALIGTGTARIDHYVKYTIDKARFGDHWYSDKAPGLAFSAVPVVALAMLPGLLAGAQPSPLLPDAGSEFFAESAVLACLATSSLATAAAAAAMFLLARHWRASRTGAMFAAASFAFATPAFGWATLFFGHAMAGACLFVAMALMVFGSDTPGRRSGGLAAAAGFLLSWSVCVEYTTAPAALLVGLFGLWRVGGTSARLRPRLLACAVAGGLLGALPLAVYNIASFGSLTHVAYADVVGFEGMKQGFFGISAPRADVLAELLVGTRRGILWLSPLLALVPLAWWQGRRWMGGPALALSIALPLTFLAINSGYRYWDGGYSTGPRHIVPALAFACLPLAALYDSAGVRLRTAMCALAGFSGALSLMCAMTDMTSPDSFTAPLWQHIIPDFIAGNLHGVFATLGLPVWLAAPGTVVIAAAAGWFAGKGTEVERPATA